MSEQQDYLSQMHSDHASVSSTLTTAFFKYQTHLAAGLIVLYVALQVALFYALDHRRIVNDEYFHRPAAIRAYDALATPNLKLSERIQRLVRCGQRYPPLTYICGIPFCYIFGKNAMSLRMVSGLAMGIAMLCVFGMLLRLSCSTLVSLSGALFFATMPFTINQSRLYMNEGLLTAVVALQYYVFVKDPDLRRSRSAIAAGCILGCGMLTKWTYPIYVAPVFLYSAALAWWPRGKVSAAGEDGAQVWKSRWNWIVICLVGLLASSAFYLHPSAWKQLEVMSWARHQGGDWRPIGVSSFLINLGELFEVLLLPWVLGPIIVILVSVGLAVLLIKRSRKSWVILLGAIGSVCLVALVLKSMARYSTPYFPLLAVAAGYGIANFPWPPARRILLELLILIVIINLAASWGVVVGSAPLYPPKKQGEDDWRIADIAEAIVRDLGGRREANVFVPFYVGEFNPSNIATYAGDQGVTLKVYSWSPEAILGPFFGVDYLVVKSGNPGNTGMLETYHRFLRALPQSFYAKHFTPLAAFPLPDGSSVTLHRANVVPMPRPDWVGTFELALQNDAQLAADPFVLIQYANALYQTGEKVRIEALSKTISSLVEKVLASEETNEVERAYLLRNYADWLLNVDKKAALDTWERLEAAKYQSFDLKKAQYPEIADAAIEVGDFERGETICRTWLESDQNNSEAQKDLVIILAKKGEDTSEALADYCQTLSQAMKTDNPLKAIAEGRSLIETCVQTGLSTPTQQIVTVLLQGIPRALQSSDSSTVIAEGKSLIEICKQAGLPDRAEHLAYVLARTFPDRKDFYWMTKSVKSVVVHKYDWRKDPIKVWGCSMTFTDSNWLKAEVNRHAYIFPAGHGRPFPCDGSYAVQFEMKVASKGPSPPGSLAVYLNTRSGLGPNGYDWGQFDAFSVPADTTGQTTTYTIPLRSNVENAKFIHEYRIDPLASTTSFTFEIGNMRLLRLESLAHEVPKPEGFIPFTVERPTTFMISTQRTLLSTSPLLLDYSPLKQLDSVMLTTGEHILTLPHGWSESDVVIRPKEGIYFGKDFLNIYGGIMEYGVAKLFVQDGKFDIATSLTAKTEYAISVEAENSHIRPVILALRSSDGKTEMAQYVFDRRDDSMSWQEKRIVPPQDMNRISVVFISDYTGPEGDLNARVRSVRVVLLGSSDNAR
jgi:4-amino-4-deoxy-L-arabinose transferase-like glycosyltransferase/tetratricopeptide (TPR) repeat protein